jgi:hypothetical protein
MGATSPARIVLRCAASAAAANAAKISQSEIRTLRRAATITAAASTSSTEALGGHSEGRAHSISREVR